MSLYLNSAGFQSPAFVFLGSHLGGSAASPSALPPRRYRTELPNLIDDLGLSVYAHRLYCHIKRVCGALGGHCTENTETLAGKCGMSTGKVSDSKRELVAAGLVHIVPGCKRLGLSDDITIIDIWAVNYAYYLAFAERKKAGLVRQVNAGSSCGESKKHQPPASAQHTEKKTTTNSGQRNNPGNDSGVVAPLPAAVPPEPDNGLIADMVAVVGSRETAWALYHKHGAAACREQLGWLPHRNAADAGAVYASSLRAGWGEPAAAKRARLETEAASVKAAQTVLHRVQAEQAARSKAGNAAALAEWYAALPDVERGAIEAAALAKARENRFFASTSEKSRAVLLDTAREAIKRGCFHACVKRKEGGNRA